MFRGRLCGRICTWSVLSPPSTLHPPRENGHVLYKDGIDADVLKFGQQPSGPIQFIVVEDRVDSHIDLGTERMGIAAKLPDVVDAVACGRTGSEARGTDIDGIGAMVDGGHATSQVLGRSQQFK